MAKPVVIVPSGGVPVTNVARLDGATPLTPVSAFGMAVTLADNALPVTLVNVDGSLWSSGPSAPGQFAGNQWSFVDLATGGAIRVTVTSLPSDGGSALTDIQLRVDGGSPISAGSAGTGFFDLTGLTNGQTYSAEIRAVNALGNGPWSAVKTASPSAPAAAISFVGSSNTTYASRSDTTISGTLGSGSIQNGDYLLLTLFIGAASEAPDPSGIPSGFVQLGTTADENDGSFNGEFRVYRKIASGESGSYTFTHTTALTQGTLSVWRGVNSTTPEDAATTVNSGKPADTTRTWTGLTTVTAGAVIVAAGFDWSDTSNNLTPPTGMTERLDLNPITYLASETIASPGATGNRSHTCNSAANAPRGGVLVALRPAGGSPAFSPSLDFSDARNSQYVALLDDF